MASPNLASKAIVHLQRTLFFLADQRKLSLLVCPIQAQDESERLSCEILSYQEAREQQSTWEFGNRDTYCAADCLKSPGLVNNDSSVEVESHNNLFAYLVTFLRVYQERSWCFHSLFRQCGADHCRFWYIIRVIRALF